MSRSNKILAHLSTCLKFLEKLYRGDSSSVGCGVSLHRNKCNEKFLETPSSTSDSAVHGKATTPVKTLKDVPGPGGLCALPYIGSMFLFHPFSKHRPEKCHLMFEELHQKYGRIVKFRKGVKWSVVLFDPDLIEEVMQHEGKYPLRPSLPLTDVYTERTKRQPGISQLQGEEWMKVRRPVQEFLLQSSNIIEYQPALDEVASEMRLTLSQQRQHDGSVPLSNIILRYAIESSAVYCVNARLGFQLKTKESHSDVTNVITCPYSTPLGQDHYQQPSNQFRQLTDDERSKLINSIKVYIGCLGEGLYTFPLYKLFRTKLYSDFELASDYLSAVVQTRLSEVANQLKKQGQRSGEYPIRTNLLQSLICDGRLDQSTCTSLLTSILCTASDNLCNSLTILLWYLAKNISKQTTLRDEINRTIQSKMIVSPDILSHMPYLKACLKESHRLTFPSPVGSMRVLPECITLDGYHIPCGSWVHFGHNALGHSDKYFEKPDKFEPERWMKQRETDSTGRRQRSIITMAFGFGRRNCVGRRLAELQIYLAVIKILQHYEITLGNPDEELDVLYKITARPSKPLDIRFHLL